MNDEQLTKCILGLLSEINQKRTALSISKKLDELAIGGYHTGSKTPFGYRSVKVGTDNFGDTVIRNKLILDQRESLIVKTLFELANNLIEQGNFGYNTIARILNEKALHRRKAKWSPKNVKSTLINHRYCGVTIYGVKRTKLNSNKKPVEIDCLAIVSKPLFDKVNHFITELRT